MPNKCLACDHLYAPGPKLCPACGKAGSIMVAEATAKAAEPLDGVTRCAIFMLLGGALTLASARPQVGFISLGLGILLLMGIEKAVSWVKALQIVKLIALGIYAVIQPALLVLLIEPVLVLGLLSRDPGKVRIATWAFAVLLALGTIAAAISMLSSPRP